MLRFARCDTPLCWLSFCHFRYGWLRRKRPAKGKFRARRRRMRPCVIGRGGGFQSITAIRRCDSGRSARNGSWEYIAGRLPFRRARAGTVKVLNSPPISNASTLRWKQEKSSRILRYALSGRNAPVKCNRLVLNRQRISLFDDFASNHSVVVRIKPKPCLRAYHPW